MNQEPIFSTHAARNNRIKALLKKRNPKQWGELTVTSVNTDLSNKKIVNRISAIKSRNTIQFEIQNLQHNRTKLHFYLEHPELISLSELHHLQPSINICIDWSTAHKEYFQHLNNRPQNLNQKRRNIYSARLSRFKKLSTLASLQEENIKLFNTLWASKTTTSSILNAEQLPSYHTENNAGYHTPITLPVTAANDNPEISINSWKKIAQLLSSPILDSSAEIPLLNNEPQHTAEKTFFNPLAINSEKRKWLIAVQSITPER